VIVKQVISPVWKCMIVYLVMCLMLPTYIYVRSMFMSD